MEEAHAPEPPVAPEAATPAPEGPKSEASGSEASPASPAPPARRPFYRRKRFLIPVGFLVVLALAVVVLGQPRAVEPAPAADAATSAIAARLAAAGITEALVDATPERVLVRYEVPEGAQPAATMYFILGAAYGAAPGAGKVVLQMFDAGAPQEEVVAAMADVRAVLLGTLDQAAFEARLDRHPLA